MRTKRVNRYYCDYCKKSGCSKYHMERHEMFCTMNPNRECRMCALVDEPQPDLAELIALLPTASWEQESEDNGLLSYDFHDALDGAMVKLKEAANGCPACMLAALRQTGIPVPMAMDYDSLRSTFWEEYNNTQHNVIDPYYRAREGGR